MVDCEKLAGCPFFNDQLASMPSMAETFKQQYCKDDNSNCARLMVAKELGAEKVPGDLFPNDVDRAKEILS